MSPEHYSETLLVQSSQLQRLAMAPPPILATQEDRLAFIESDPHVRAEDIVEKYGVSRRTAFRDLSLLGRRQAAYDKAHHRRFLILWTLDERKPITAHALAKRFNVSIRAIYRDMAYLSPVHEAFNGHGGGYLRKR